MLAPSRKHFKHDWQEHMPTTSADFAVHSNEDLKNGPLTKLEFFILVNIYEYCDEENLEPTKENIFVIYNRILAAATDINPSLTLRILSDETFLKFTEHRQKDVEVFTAKCEMQLQWNITEEI